MTSFFFWSQFPFVHIIVNNEDAFFLNQHLIVLFKCFRKCAFDLDSTFCCNHLTGSCKDLSIIVFLNTCSLTIYPLKLSSEAAEFCERGTTRSICTCTSFVNPYWFDCLKLDLLLLVVSWSVETSVLRRNTLLWCSKINHSQRPRVLNFTEFHSTDSDFKVTDNVKTIATEWP